MTERSLVYVYSIGPPRRFVGCGALVEGGYIATCRHVWDKATRGDTSQGSDKVDVEFPRSRNDDDSPILSPASLVELLNDLPGVSPDLALLRPDTLPNSATILQVAWSERFETGAGYAIAGLVGRDKSKPGTPRDIRVDGVVAPHIDGQGLRQFTGSNLGGFWTDRGSSGSPVFLNGGMQLAGILALSEVGVNAGASQLHEAFIVPGTAIRSYLVRLSAQPTEDRKNIAEPVLLQILETISFSKVPAAEIPKHLRQYIEAAHRRAETRVEQSDGADDIEVVIEASRGKLRSLDAIGAREILCAKIGDERRLIAHRLLPLLRELAALERLAFQYDSAMKTLTEITILDQDDVGSWVELGELRELTGTLDGAADAYVHAEQAARRSGNDLDLKDSIDKIGGVLEAQGDRNKALARYRESLAIAKRAVKAAPSNTDWQRALSLSFRNIGDVLNAQGALDVALDHYRDGFNIARRLTKEDPSNAKWHRDLSVSLDHIGEVLGKQANFDKALARYKESLAIAQQLADADPSNAERQRDLAVSLDNVGDTLCSQGKPDEALTFHQRSVPIMERLTAVDPFNTRWQRDLSVSFDNISRALEDQGSRNEALLYRQKDLELARRLSAADPSSAEWRADLAISCDGVARLGGDGASALRREAITILESLDRDGRLAQEHKDFLTQLKETSRAKPRSRRNSRRSLAFPRTRR